MKWFYIAGLLSFASACLAEVTPATMTRLVAKRSGTRIEASGFEALPKLYHRAGTRYCRLEEDPDPVKKVHRLMIINEPHGWWINLLDSSARHQVDLGPDFGCQLPIFLDVDELQDLEFGREMEFFRSRTATSSGQPGPELLGRKSVAYQLKLEDMDLTLYTTGRSELGWKQEVPLGLKRRNDNGSDELVLYPEYVVLPFDGKMFSLPAGLKKIDEIRAQPQGLRIR